jgi:hypothetical protein
LLFLKSLPWALNFIDFFGAHTFECTFVFLLSFLWKLASPRSFEKDKRQKPFFEKLKRAWGLEGPSESGVRKRKGEKKRLV